MGPKSSSGELTGKKPNVVQTEVTLADVQKGGLEPFELECQLA